MELRAKEYTGLSIRLIYLYRQTVLKMVFMYGLILCIIIILLKYRKNLSDKMKNNNDNSNITSSN